MIENPATSGLWDYQPISKELVRLGCAEVPVDMCAYGAPYKKPTMFKTNIPELQTVARSCRCVVPHEHLQGLCF